MLNKLFLVTTASVGLTALSFAGTFSIDPPEILGGATAMYYADGGFYELPVPSYPLDFLYGAFKLAAAGFNGSQQFFPQVSGYVRWKVKWLQSGSEAAPADGILHIQTYGHNYATSGGWSANTTGVLSSLAEVNDFYLGARHVPFALFGVGASGSGVGSTTDTSIDVILAGVTFTQKTQHQWSGWATVEIGFLSQVMASASKSNGTSGDGGCSATVDALCQLHPLEIQTGAGNATFQTSL